jgi:hypothetical protein
MRFSGVLLLLLLLLAGCPLATGPSTGECFTDGDCLGNVCARDGFCHPPSDVREVRTTWTIRGQPATTSTCSTSMDKLPRSYTIVELGRDGGFPDSKAIGATGEVSFDLRFQ